MEELKSIAARELNLSDDLYKLAVSKFCKNDILTIGRVTDEN